MTLLGSRYDAETRMNTFTRRFELVLADGTEVFEEIFSAKHFASLEQIREWLSHAGFVIETECGDYQGNPISDETNRAIVWARKKA